VYLSNAPPSGVYMDGTVTRDDNVLHIKIHKSNNTLLCIFIV
jgi:hypothetical protein